MKIAVAIDGSENALRAAKHVIQMVEHVPDAMIKIIFVADYNKAKDDLLLSQSQASLTLKRKQKILPVLELIKAKNIDTEVITLKGKPSDEIINYVNQSSIDLLVVGSRGLNAFQEMILGSVSHKVMKHVKCPVTVVK